MYRVISIDGTSIVWFAGDGDGTELNPFISDVNIANYPDTFAATQSGNWTVTGDFYPETQPISHQTLVAGIKSPANSLSVIQSYAETSTLSNVTSSASSVTLLAANNNRKTAIIYNDSTSILYVTLNASTASTTNNSFKIYPDGSAIIKGDDYSGEIRGIWASANGFARITEVY